MVSPAVLFIGVLLLDDAPVRCGWLLGRRDPTATNLNAKSGFRKVILLITIDISIFCIQNLLSRLG